MAVAIFLDYWCCTGESTTELQAYQVHVIDFL